MSKPINAKNFSRIMKVAARIPSQITAQVSKDIKAEIEKNFDRGVDPFGRKWKGLAKSTLARGRTPPPLTDTRAGRNSVIVHPSSGAGIMITVGIQYMIYHQFGSKKTKRLPRRAFIPMNKLPTAWAEIFLFRLEQMADKVINRG